VRGYSAICEGAEPSELARQLNAHRAQMTRAITGAGGTLMQFVGDAVMGVFGAPLPLDDHAARAVAAAQEMHAQQARLNERWQADGLRPFPLGIGVSTGTVAAALLGAEERVEYTVVGDSVNLAQRLQQLAAGGETVLSEATLERLPSPPALEVLPPTQVKGRASPVLAYRLAEQERPREAAAAAVRVLVVDDQTPFREAAKLVVDAESGEAAVELATTLKPDLVLMDVNLPAMNGMEATRRILDALPETTIIALSTEVGLATRAVASGAVTFVSKSEFDPDRLVGAWTSARG
jgi:class 3 adenylate cyclase